MEFRIALPGYVSWYPKLDFIVDENCYRTKVMTISFVDKNRPNSKKPLFIRKTVQEPGIVREGNIIRIHPKLWVTLNQKMGIIAQASYNKMVADAFYGHMTIDEHKRFHPDAFTMNILGSDGT